MSLLELFCAVDDFCRHLELAWQQQQLASGLRQHQRTRQLCLSELMTSLIAYHCSGFRNFRTYYREQVCRYGHAEFPGLVSYPRFVEFISSTLLPLCAYLRTNLGSSTGISFLDSTPPAVYDNHRIHQHRVFDGVAQRDEFLGQLFVRTVQLRRDAQPRLPRL